MVPRVGAGPLRPRASDRLGARASSQISSEPSFPRFHAPGPSRGPLSSLMEFVYVVPREKLFPAAYPHGLVAFGEEWTRTDFERAVHDSGFFVEREHAERTPALQQIIPYAIVRSADGERVLLVRRLRAGGEARLHDKLSIGIGGHVNPVDVEPAGRDALLDSATRRELEEELHIEGDYDVQPVGLLNDDTNPVGAVHVGLVQIVTTRGEVTIREQQQLSGALTPLPELARLAAEGANLETWSRLLVERLEPLLSNPPAPFPSASPTSSPATVRTESAGRSTAKSR